MSVCDVDSPDSLCECVMSVYGCVMSGCVMSECVMWIHQTPFVSV